MLARIANEGCLESSAPGWISEGLARTSTEKAKESGPKSVQAPARLSARATQHVQAPIGLSIRFQKPAAHNQLRAYASGSDTRGALSPERGSPCFFSVSHLRAQRIRQGQGTTLGVGWPQPGTRPPSRPHGRCAGQTPPRSAADRPASFKAPLACQGGRDGTDDDAPVPIARMARLQGERGLVSLA